MKTIFPDKFRGPIAVKVVCPLILMAIAAAFLTNPLVFASSSKSSNLSINNATKANKQAIVKIAKVQVVPSKTKVSALTTAKGFALYYDDLDTDPTQPDCSEDTNQSCTSVWPPLLLPKGGSLKVTKLSGKLVAAKNANGQQVTYNGHLLYTYEQDTKPLVAKGNLVGGIWHVAIATTARQQIQSPPSGEPLIPPPAVGQPTICGVPVR